MPFPISAKPPCFFLLLSDFSHKIHVFPPLTTVSSLVYSIFHNLFIPNPFIFPPNRITIKGSTLYFPLLKRNAVEFGVPYSRCSNEAQRSLRFLTPAAQTERSGVWGSLLPLLKRNAVEFGVPYSRCSNGTQRSLRFLTPAAQTKHSGVWGSLLPLLKRSTAEFEVPDTSAEQFKNTIN